VSEQQARKEKNRPETQKKKNSRKQKKSARSRQIEKNPTTKKIEKPRECSERKTEKLFVRGKRRAGCSGVRGLAWGARVPNII
jgi:hypothetical protein